MSETKKEVAPFRLAIDFFSDTALKTRGFRPQITNADIGRLKAVSKAKILTLSKIEQLMLYFLADPSYRNLGPSIATMLSATVLNSLHNKLLNRAQFHKELDGYVMRVWQKPIAGQRVNDKEVVELKAAIEALKTKFTIKQTKQHGE